MHEEWTDKLSDYLDDELPPEERRAVAAHLAGCEPCAATLDELKRVVARARSLPARPPATDLWRGIAERIDDRPAARVASFAPRGPARRVSFTLPQLAAASLLIAALSGGLVWMAGARAPRATTEESAATRPAEAAQTRTDESATASIESVSLADAQYDAAVADLERALDKGRGRLDRSTIAAVEQSLQIIDQAIAQARQALATDPANSYLSSHLVETRRRKLDLLRRAAALTSETN